MNLLACLSTTVPSPTTYPENILWPHAPIDADSKTKPKLSTIQRCPTGTQQADSEPWQLGGVSDLSRIAFQISTDGKKEESWKRVRGDQEVDTGHPDTLTLRHIALDVNCFGWGGEASL